MPEYAQRSPLRDRDTPFETPHFAPIRDEDFMPALAQAMRRNVEEAEAIANNPATPTFVNVVEAMERADRGLDNFFFNT